MKNLTLLVLVCSALVLPACGNGTSTIAGASSITVSSITGGPFITVTPTLFQVTGTQFAQAAGSTATVRFTAEGGIFAFDGGTSNTLDVPVIILDDGTVEGTTPSFLYPGIFNAFVTVILPSTAQGTSDTAIAQFIGIQVNSVTPNIVPSDSQLLLDIGGTGFSPPAGNVNVSFIAETGTPFLNGTVDTIGPVPGTVNSLTSILANAPIAGVNLNVPAFISVEFVDLPGAPVIQSTNPIVTFVPPTVDSTSVISVPSEIPTPVTITGTGYGPIASNVTVTLMADAGTPFLNGTAASIDVVGVVTSNTTIDMTTPIFQVATSTQPTGVGIMLNSGAGGVSVGPLFSVLRPTVDSVDLANVPSEIPTLLTITGTGFAPNGSNPTVRFRAPAGTPFLGGTASFLDVTGSVVNDTTIVCTTPRAGLSAALAANIGVFLTTGITEILSGTPLVTFDPPVIASVSPTMIESEIPEVVTITGTGFGSATGLANVTLSAAGTPFSLGTQPSLTVVGTVVNPTTITFTSPISGVQADTVADVTAVFPTNASTTTSGAGLLTIKTPTVTASSLANVPSEIPTAITITGTGFAGGAPTVRFIASAGTPFLGGTASILDVPGTITGPTTVTCTTPRTGVSLAQPSQIQVRLTGGLNPTSAGNLITFDPPTITSIVPTMVESEIPTVCTITGTGYGSVSGTVNVTLSGAGTPFSLGTLPSLTVVGTIVNPTTITFTSPICGVLADLNANVTLSFATGSSVTSVAALLIKTPTVTASSLATVDSENPTLITITGTGFAGGTPTVRFANGTSPYLGGTANTIDATGVTLVNATTITCTTPRAGVNVNAGSTIQVLLTGGLQPISAGPLVTFIAPTVTSCAPLLIDAATATLVTVTGTGFYAPGTVTMRFIAATGTPFSGSATLDVTGTIVNPTTVTGTTPSLTLSNKAVCSVAIVFASGAAPTSGPACTTFEVPPVAVDDNYGVDGNVQLVVNIANGVIQGVGTDSDPDGDPITVSAFDAASVQGGDVAVAADGSFTYNPPAGYEGADSFTYTITDGFLFDNATVNLTVSGMVWFIDNNQAAAGDGRFTSPFNTLAGFIAAGGANPPAAGDTIFVYSSATDYTGNLTLLANQILLGNGVALNHPGPNGTDPLVAASTNPDVNSTAGTTVTLGTGNTVRGLDIESTSGTALRAVPLTGTANVDTVNLDAIGGPALQISGGTLAATFGTIGSTNSTADGIDLDGVAGTMTVSGATTISGSVDDGIDIDASTGTFTFASLDLDLTTGDGINLNNVAGTVQVTGTGTIDDTGANGILVTGGTANIDFNILTITSSADDGIFLNGAGGTFDVTGNGNIVTPGNDGASPGLDHGIDINGGSVAVTFADLDIVDSHGHGVEINGTSGAISLTGDLGAGAEASDIHNTDDVGIHCTVCTGTLTFTDLFIDESGDAAVNAQESHGIRIDDCTGNITIDGCTIDDCAETLTGDGQGFDNNCIHLRMDDGGTLPSLQITDCTFSGTEVAGEGDTTDHGVFVRLEGGSIISDMDVTGCLCNDVGRAFCEVLIDGDDNGDNPRILNLNVSDNGTTANPIETQAEGIHLRNNGVSVLPIFHFDSNIINGTGALSSGNGIRVNVGEFPIGINATATATGTCNDNNIDNVGDFGGDNGIEFQCQNDGNLIIEIDGNDIDGGSDVGIRGRGFDTSDTQATISNNDIGLNALHFAEGVEVQTRSGTPVLCLDCFGNDCAAGDDYVMNHDAGTFNLLNIGAGTHTPAQVDTFLEAQNTGNAASLAGTYTQCTSITTP